MFQAILSHISKVLSHAGAYYTWFGNDTKAKKYTVGILVALSIVQSCIEDFKLWCAPTRNTLISSDLDLGLFSFRVTSKLQKSRLVPLSILPRWQRGSLLWSDLCVSGVTNSIVEFWYGGRRVSRFKLTQTHRFILRCWKMAE